MKPKKVVMKKKKNKKNTNTEENVEFSKASLNWFPGHMVKAMKKIQEKIKTVDIILELRDARSPLVTANEELVKISNNKPRLIVINKTNLADEKIIALWEKWFTAQGDPFIFVNALDKKSLDLVVKLSRKVLEDNHLKSNPDSLVKEKMKMMIIGLPNTGKSTIINRLSNRDVTKVADKPGQTQNQIWITVNKNLEILDTPGIMPPNIKTKEQSIWLSALHAIPERVTDAEDIACYLINFCLSQDLSILESVYKISIEDKQLIPVLEAICKSRGFIRKGHEYDYERAYTVIVNDFRSGRLGKISFGLPPKLP